MSLEALMMRSLRSWCSSSSARKPSNMDMIGDEPVVLSCSSIAACGRLTPIGVMYLDFVKMRCSYAGSCCLMRCCSTKGPGVGASALGRGKILSCCDASCCATPSPVFTRPPPLHALGSCSPVQRGSQKPIGRQDCSSDSGRISRTVGTI